ncbi:MAG: M23 family metallopeptidase [Sulfurospirillaceae bacterium]
MRILLIFLLLMKLVFAEVAINGKIYLLPLEKDVKEVLIGSKKTPILSKDGERVALIAVPYRQSEKIEVGLIKKNSKEAKAIEVVKGDYFSETLQVEPSKITPPKELEERIKAEYEEAMKIYATFSSERFWSEDFLTPLSSKITSPFGAARVFNDSLKSYHSGVDFRAAIGTKIHATNDGIVVLSKERYYAGGSVIIDHGEGIYSSYLHLSQMPLQVGDRVKKGDLIGYSGASGRVTGPHLHFGIIIQGTTVDPLHFIKTINELNSSIGFNGVDTKNYDDKGSNDS